MPRDSRLQPRDSRLQRPMDWRLRVEHQCSMGMMGVESERDIRDGIRDGIRDDNITDIGDIKDLYIDKICLPRQT